MWIKYRGNGQGQPKQSAANISRRGPAGSRRRGADVLLHGGLPAEVHRAGTVREALPQGVGRGPATGTAKRPTARARDHVDTEGNRREAAEALPHDWQDGE